MGREPDFENLLKVMRREKPDRPTLYEFIINGKIMQEAVGLDSPAPNDPLRNQIMRIRAFRKLGYDYVQFPGSPFGFPKSKTQRLKSKSLNEGAVIFDRAGFEAYPWPDPNAFDYSWLGSLAAELPDGMKVIVNSPGGVLENAIELVGFDRLCIMVMEEPELAGEIFDAVGSRMLRYFELSLQFDTVGAIVSNDDWGFKQQTMLAPDQMRRYVFPWHKRIVAAAHAAGRPAFLHSCGNLATVMDDVIDDMRFDAKHSYEDVIMPVEEAYERWGGRIAIFGGMDVDFVCRSTPDQVYRRAKAMLERTQDRGGYALGTGNSVPDYVPTENYLAMIRAATENGA
jgi:uroporphyrinogen decarboxylase